MVDGNWIVYETVIENHLGFYSSFCGDVKACRFGGNSGSVNIRHEELIGIDV